MPSPAPPSNRGRWRDIEGTQISVFCTVEQVADSSEPTMLCSRLHQRGRVVGRGLDSVYVCFPGNQVISVAPQLLRVLDQDEASAANPDRAGE